MAVPEPHTTAPAPPSRAMRLAIAAAVAVASAAYVHIFYRHQSALAVSDFDAIWTAARALRAGQDPYAAIATPPWPWDLQYPLPAVLVILPFSYLPLLAARAAFAALSAALLAYGLTRRALWPLIVLVSGQFFYALQSVQWTPLFTAAVLLPVLRLLWLVKPTTGLALFAGYPQRYTLAGGAVLFGLAFLVWPEWLAGWLTAVGRAPHGPSVLKPGGFLLLLALLRWRLPEARQLAVLACMPTSPHLYEALPLMLVARSRRELMILAVCGGLGLSVNALMPVPHGPDHGLVPWAIVYGSAYLPALLVVLTHRNVRATGLEPFRPLPPAEPLPASPSPGVPDAAAL